MTETPTHPLKRDLGTLDGPLLAFGGPLSNGDALDALWKEARRLRIGPDRMICTGDVAGYGAEPEECLTRLRESGVATVLGNVEEALAIGAADCGCNFIEGSTCDALAGDWYRYALDHVSAENRAWMRALPRQLTFRLAGQLVTVTHGGLRQINRYIFASETGALASECRGLDEPGPVIAGHSGIPFSRVVPDMLWHNPGSLGLPANDGTPRVWYALITADDDGGILFRHVPLDYDFRAAAAKMRAAGLPEAYARALETGLWPDTAILPPTEKAATGKPCDPAPVVWV